MKGRLVLLVVLVVALLHGVEGFLLRRPMPSALLLSLRRNSVHKRQMSSEDDMTTSESEMNEDVKEIAPLLEQIRMPKVTTSMESKVIGKEEVFRKFQHEDKGLPTLDDTNNYWSGQLDQCFWQQNADQVHVFCPLPADVHRRDVTVRFETTQVVVKVHDEVYFTFKPFDRVIPDGCFWTMEEDREKQVYVMLDLEKRLRMLNWQTLLADHRNDTKRSATQQGPSDAERRADLMQKLFAANKGLSKVTGLPEESWEDMLRDDKLQQAVNSPIRSKPTIIERMDDGTEREVESIEGLDTLEMEYSVREAFQAALDEVRIKSDHDDEQQQQQGLDEEGDDDEEVVVEEASQ